MSLVRQDLDELLAYGPYLRAGVHGRTSGEVDHESEYYPPYPPRVEEFMKLLIRCWCAPSYDPRLHGEMLRDDAAVATASLDEIRSMFTFCIRSERFGEGNFGALIQEGRIAALFLRLGQLRESLSNN